MAPGVSAVPQRLHSELGHALREQRRPGRFDPGQVEQALIDLIRNAHESSSPPEDVTLAVCQRAEEVHLAVADRGPGMSDAALAQALLPFYSTRGHGTGLGLALRSRSLGTSGSPNQFLADGPCRKRCL